MGQHSGAVAQAQASRSCCCVPHREHLENTSDPTRGRSRQCSSPSPRTPTGTPNGWRWSSGLRSASTAAWSGVPRRVFQRLLPERPTPERCVEAYYVQRTRFEGIAECKLPPASVYRGRESWRSTGGFGSGATAGHLAHRRKHTPRSTAP